MSETVECKRDFQVPFLQTVDKVPPILKLSARQIKRRTPSEGTVEIDDCELVDDEAALQVQRREHSALLGL